MKHEIILLADDDEGDRILVRAALLRAGLRNPLETVRDGVELLARLRATTGHEPRPPRPALILLDLNMPRMSGRAALKVIKEDPDLREIPVVVMTTSGSAADVRECYRLGANSYITKPVDFSGLVEIMEAVGVYWLQVVRRPPVAEA